MLVKLFVLGHPGSGKSTISRNIVTHIVQNQEDWLVQHITDYNILYKMFKVDHAQKEFLSTAHDGFHVLKQYVYNRALKTLKWQIRQIENLLPPQKDKLLLVEFARSDYQLAFKQFGKSFLKNSYFIFLDTEIDTCIYRINRRISNPTTEDDHFVAKSIFESYYLRNPKNYLTSSFSADFNLDKNLIKIIDNNVSQEIAIKIVDSWVEHLLNPNCFSQKKSDLILV